ncbi:MAG TPA: fumarylacetoacetate hydrolase family protein [Saprospiraceae bacterium]|nr:fumarylacetoacetate hydrolase family protein [Saprospiraceae bacterium]HPK10607.1 fumarylacetoacetate hydrolase family protein [Saprospiraceae bacterium]HRX27925.1 fumarylacetoacetate hydrolase family protein [Saprospiraceae bacterium]
MIKKAVDALIKASESGKVCEPIREIIGDDDIEAAYKIQSKITARRLKSGAKIVGKKIGLTSFAVQQQLGVNQPDFGILFDDMEVLQGQSLSISKTMQAKVEAEIAFVLSKDLDGDDIRLIDIMDATAYCLPAIEIVGSRIKDWNIKITDTIADNASASHFVLGHTPKKLGEFDIVNCEMKLWVNELLCAEGSGDQCMGSPLNAVLWLAKTMKLIKSPLRKGDIILSGALGKMTNVYAGDKVKTTISGLGDVSMTFSD